MVIKWVSKLARDFNMKASSLSYQRKKALMNALGLHFRPLDNNCASLAPEYVRGDARTIKSRRTLCMLKY